MQLFYIFNIELAIKDHETFRNRVRVCVRVYVLVCVRVRATRTLNRCLRVSLGVSRTFLFHPRDIVSAEHRRFATLTLARFPQQRAADTAQIVAAAGEPHSRVWHTVVSPASTPVATAPIVITKRFS